MLKKELLSLVVPLDKVTTEERMHRLNFMLEAYNHIACKTHLCFCVQ